MGVPIDWRCSPHLDAVLAHSAEQRVLGLNAPDPSTLLYFSLKGNQHLV